MTKEQQFLSIIDGHNIERKSDTSMLYLDKAGEVLFQIEDNILWCNTALIYLRFSKSFITKMIEKYLKLTNLIPKPLTACT